MRKTFEQSVQEAFDNVDAAETDLNIRWIKLDQDAAEAASAALQNAKQALRAAWVALTGE